MIIYKLQTRWGTVHAWIDVELEQDAKLLYPECDALQSAGYDVRIIPKPVTVYCCK